MSGSFSSGIPNGLHFRVGLPSSRDLKFFSDHANFVHLTIALLCGVLFLYILKLEHSSICSMFYSLFVHIACESKVHALNEWWEAHPQAHVKNVNNIEKWFKRNTICLLECVIIRGSSFLWNVYMVDGSFLS